MKYLVGIDLGTTALKGVVVNETGGVISKANRLSEYDYYGNGFVEFSAETYYKTLGLLVTELTKPLSKDDTVTAISISGASGNTILLDKKKKPIMKAISWLDNREDVLNEIFSEDIVNEIYNIAGWPYLGIFPLTHLAWLKQNKTLEYSTAKYMMLNISYIYYRLTAQFAIDYSTATTFYLANQESKKWHIPFLEHLNIKEPMLPQLLPSGTKINTITKEASFETGLSQKTKVVLGAFDHAAAARGTGVFDTGSMLLSCGTSWVGFYPILKRETGIKNKMLIDPFMSPQGNWGAMFSISGIGKTIDFIIDYLIEAKTMEEKYTIFNRLAQQSANGANGTFLNIVLSNDKLKTTIDNLLKTTNLSDIFRALMESIAFEIKRNIIQYEKHNIKATEITMVGGASKSKLWTRVISDITERNIRLLNGQYAGALGSAIMAGIGAGIFVDERDGFQKIGGTPVVIEPNTLNKKLYQENFKKYEIFKSINNDK